MSANRQSILPTASECIDYAAILLLSVAALYGFQSSFGGIEYLVVGVVAAVLGVLLVHVLGRTRVPLLAAIGFAIVTYLILAGPIALRGLASGGFIPNLDTIRAAGRTEVVGWKELITTNPPVSGVGELMVLPFFCGFFGAFSTAVLMRRLRASLLCIIPLVLVLAAGIITGTVRPASLLLQGGLFAAITLGWLAVRYHRSRPKLGDSTVRASRLVSAVVVLALAAVGGLVVGPRLPLAQASARTIWRTQPPWDPAQYPSPLSGYREYLKNKDLRDKPLFAIEGLPPDTLVRLATMDAYDGLVWKPGFQAEQPNELNSGYFQRMGSQIASDFPGTIAKITVTIQAYSDVWVPDVGEVLSLKFEGGPRDRQLNDSFRYNPASDTGLAPLSLQRGDRYTMTVRLPPKVANLATKPIDPSMFVAPADPRPAELDKWTQTPEILAIPDPGARIDALVLRMKELGVYSDGDESKNQQPSQAGHSLYRLSTFVDPQNQTLLGNAEQYAAGLALMLRGLGKIPSRVVMGFKPAVVGTGSITVTGHDVNAWVEVPVTGVGWMAVFPTPDESDSQPKTRKPSQPEPDYQTQVPPPPPLAEPEFNSPATSKSGAKDTAGKKADQLAGTKAGNGIPTAVLVGAGVVLFPVMIAGLIIGLITAFKVRRRRRRRTAGPGHERIANGWREFTDSAIDLGLPMPTTSTRREAAQFAGPSSVALAQYADAAVFGPAEPPEEQVEEYWNDMERLVHSMYQERSVTQRLRARLNLSTFEAGPLRRVWSKLSLTSLRKANES